MLSKRERHFLEDPFSFTSSQARAIRYRIRKKFDRTIDDLIMIMKNNNSIQIDGEKIAELKERLSAYQNFDTYQNSGAPNSRKDNNVKDDLYYLENW